MDQCRNLEHTQEEALVFSGTQKTFYFTNINLKYISRVHTNIKADNKPNVVLACCIFLYLSKLGHKISVRKSAEICQVSATSVNNLKNKIKKDSKFKLCIKTFLIDY